MTDDFTWIKSKVFTGLPGYTPLSDKEIKALKDFWENEDIGRYLLALIPTANHHAPQFSGLPRGVVAVLDPNASVYDMRHIICEGKRFVYTALIELRPPDGDSGSISSDFLGSVPAKSSRAQKLVDTFIPENAGRKGPSLTLPVHKTDENGHSKVEDKREWDMELGEGGRVEFGVYEKNDRELGKTIKYVATVRYNPTRMVNELLTIIESNPDRFLNVKLEHFNSLPEVQDLKRIASRNALRLVCRSLEMMARKDPRSPPMYVYNVTDDEETKMSAQKSWRLARPTVENWEGVLDYIYTNGHDDDLVRACGDLEYVSVLYDKSYSPQWSRGGFIFPINPIDGTLIAKCENTLSYETPWVNSYFGILPSGFSGKYQVLSAAAQIIDGNDMQIRESIAPKLNDISLYASGAKNSITTADGKEHFLNVRMFSDNYPMLTDEYRKMQDILGINVFTAGDIWTHETYAPAFVIRSGCTEEDMTLLEIDQRSAPIGF